MTQGKKTFRSSKSGGGGKTKSLVEEEVWPGKIGQDKKPGPREITPWSGTEKSPTAKVWHPQTVDFDHKGGCLGELGGRERKEPWKKKGMRRTGASTRRDGTHAGRGREKGRDQKGEKAVRTELPAEGNKMSRRILHAG